MNQSLIAIALIALGPAFALAQSNGAQEVEITGEPSHHLVLENDYVRAFSVSVAPHTATLMHRHRHDYVFVTLGDARISNEVEGKEAVEAVLSDGATRFTAGNFAHIARNLGDTPFRNVTIEIVQDEKQRGSAAHWDKDSGEETSLGWDKKILFVKDGVRVSQVELDAKARLPKGHGDGPTLLVAVSDCELEPNADAKGSDCKDSEGGEFWWSDGASSVINTGTAPARLVMLEF